MGWPVGIQAKLQPCQFDFSGVSARPARGQQANWPWRDPKRYVWLLGAVVPGLVAASWLLVWLTGICELWWSGPLLAFGAIPVLDHLLGPDPSNPPESALAWLSGIAYTVGPLTFICRISTDH